MASAKKSYVFKDDFKYAHDGIHVVQYLEGEEVPEKILERCRELRVVKEVTAKTAAKDAD